MRRDLLWAYAASAARVLSWVVVSAVVFRASPLHFAILALIRGTMGLLNYTTVGLAPALVKMIAEARVAPKPVLPLAPKPGDTLDYARPLGADLRLQDPVKTVYASGLTLACAAGAIALVFAGVYANVFESVHHVDFYVQAAGQAALAFGLGVVLRLSSEASGAAIQTGGRIALDNALVFISEMIWVAAVISWNGGEFGFVYRADGVLFRASLGFAVSGAFLLIARVIFAGRITSLYLPDRRFVDPHVAKLLLAAGSLIAVAQLADFLYVPTDYILINHLISPEAIASYGPPLQIDAGLLLLVGAIASVLLPKASIAHASNDVKRLRDYYIRGTLAGAAMLLVASVAMYFLSGEIFRIWLGTDLPEGRAILPFVLIHTVLGGASGVGRSILLAMGKAKPFAIAVLVAGASNVILSYSFVKFFDLGLKGIVLGTICAVVGRGVIWQPWYVLRTLRREERDRQGRFSDPVNLDDASAPEIPL
jgi:O-antigen/teichoic acid export membrane protein